LLREHPDIAPTGKRRFDYVLVTSSRI